MKRFLFFLVTVFFSTHASFAQATVFDSALNALMGLSYADQLIYYTQSIKDNVTQIQHLKEQIEKTGQQINMAAQNMKSLKDIHSWDDFMDFYNRQLYLEHMAVDSVKGMNVSIGKKNYSLYDLEGIADGLDDTYVEYWNKEFTEEQRREMWLGLGLSPSNYAYVQPYREKGKEVARELLAMSEIQNRKNNAFSEKNKQDMIDLLHDVSLPADRQMGQKEVQQKILMSSIRNGEMLADIAAMQSKDLEMKGIDKALDKPLKSSPEISFWGNGFRRLKNDKEKKEK